MPTFAHIETGIVRDARDAADVNGYRALFPATDTSSWRIVAVADASVEGSSASLASTPAELSGVEFHNHCAKQIATANSTTAQQGMARLGSILAALESARTGGGLLMIAWVRYNAAGVPDGRYSFSDTQTLLAALVAANIATQTEATAIIANWPHS